MNMTLEQKQDLQGAVEGGVQVASVCYNPLTVTGDPEGDAIADGWVEYMREDTTDLVEVIYTK